MDKLYTNVGHKIWTDAERAVIKELYESTPTKYIAQQLNRSDKAVYQQAKMMGIKKNEAFYNNPELSGRLTALAAKGYNLRFKKGNTPPNKGKKQTEYMSAASIEKTAATRFKKGQIPHNAKPANGAISIRKDNKGISYQYIRVELGKWELLQRVIYEQHFGKIPQGMIVIFKDGNTLNCEPTNLEAITRAQHLERNQDKHNGYDEHTKTAIKLINKIQKKVKNHAT